MPPKTKKNAKSDIELDKEIFIQNRSSRIKEYDSIIDNYSPDNKFDKQAIIRTIVEQEGFVKHLPKITNRINQVKEETDILKDFIKKAKRVFGKDYQRIYDECIKN